MDKRLMRRLVVKLLVIMCLVLTFGIEIIKKEVIATELENELTVTDQIEASEEVIFDKPQPPEDFIGENPSSNEIFTVMNEDGNVEDRTEKILTPSETESISMFALGPQLVDFKIKDINTITKYTEYGTGYSGYTHGAYGGDALYLGEVNGKIKFMMSGVTGLINPENVNLVVFTNAKSFSYYQVNNNGNLIHYITTDVNKTEQELINNGGISKLNNGPAPSYLEKNVKYLSYDGHYFYTVDQYNAMQEDCNAGHRNNSINPNNPFYNYYQFLPFRSITNYSEIELTNIINNNSNIQGTNSKLINLGSSFVNNQNKYGVNALLAVGVACNESGWGKSNYAQNRNNLFGINAPDVDPNKATYFSDTNSCVERFMDHYVSKYYCNPDNWRYNGAFLGNKASGMNVQWASDPYWGEKAAAIVWNLDTAGGNKDLHKYTIGIKDLISTNHTGLNIRNNASTSSNIIYNTSLSGHAFLILNSTPSNGFYKIQSESVLNSGRTSIDSSTGIYDVNNMYLYVSADYVTIISKGQDISYDISYSTHVSNIGWMNEVGDGAVGGTTGRALPMEAIKINTNSDLNLSVSYSAHVSNIGWMDWVKEGQIGGTTGRAESMEAIKISLSGADAEKYDIYYQVHVANVGWLGWARNGEPAGSAGYSYPLESIRIKLVKKGAGAPGSTYNSYIEAAIACSAHVKNVGWTTWVADGQTAGTTGRSLNLEALQISIINKPNLKVSYRVHVANVGWMNWVKDGSIAGTTGRSLPIEAIEMKLTGDNADKYDVYYRAHVANVGWLDWAKSGEPAGSAGYAYAMEAIQMCVMPKTSGAPGTTTTPFINK